MSDYFGCFECQWVQCQLIMSIEHNMQIMHILHVCLIWTCPRNPKKMKGKIDHLKYVDLWVSCSQLRRGSIQLQLLSQLSTSPLSFFFTFFHPIFFGIPCFLLDRPWNSPSSKPSCPTYILKAEAVLFHMALSWIVRTMSKCWVIHVLVFLFSMFFGFSAQSSWRSLLKTLKLAVWALSSNFL